jgi:hypothetical protein
MIFFTEFSFLQQNFDFATKTLKINEKFLFDRSTICFNLRPNISGLQALLEKVF